MSPRMIFNDRLVSTCETDFNRMPFLVSSMKTMVLMIALSVGAAHADVDLVKVDKSERKMYLYDGNRIVKTYDVALGPHPEGPKQREGDGRTPEGRYVLDYKKSDSSFHKAMHISYPNQQDRENARKLGVPPGGLIMIHGQRNWLGWLAAITQRFNWTNGCIAVTNAEMDEFMGLVKVGTPIRIEW
jgi:murein L,D-transpeptidase YafK